MNREILFRGLKADGSNEWVYGNLLQSEITVNDTCRCAITEKFMDDYSLKVHEVIPSTVGQFTGLTDKNGTRIFEGDIVKYYKLDKYIQQSHHDVRPEINESIVNECVDVILFKNGAFIFDKEYEEDFTISYSASGLHNLEEIQDMFIEYDGLFTDCNGNEINHTIIGFEVIGNIHQK